MAKYNTDAGLTINLRVMGAVNRIVEV